MNYEIGKISKEKGIFVSVCDAKEECSFFFPAIAINAVSYTHLFRVKDRIMEKVLYHLNYRLKNDVDIEVVMFTTDKNHIIMSDNAKELIKYFAEECNEG